MINLQQMLLDYIIYLQLTLFYWFYCFVFWLFLLLSLIHVLYSNFLCKLQYVTHCFLCQYSNDGRVSF